MKIRFQTTTRRALFSRLAAAMLVAMFGISSFTAQAQDYRAQDKNIVSVAGQTQAATGSFSQNESNVQTDQAPISQPVSNGAFRITLDEAIGMALQHNTGIQLAAANARAKAFATDIARSDYFPKVDGTAGAFHFNEELGKVLRQGALGVEEVGIVGEDAAWAGVTVGQPITQLLVIQQAVQLAEADRRIAQAQLQGGQRDLAFGVTQLYHGLLAAQQGQQAAQLQMGAAGASNDPAAKIAALQAQQANMKAEGQVTELRQQLNSILSVPLDTQLQLVEPPLPDAVEVDVHQAMASALSCSPEVREAREGIAKACAAMKIAKLDYVPAIDVVGGYLHQDVLPIISQNDITFIGLTGSLPIFEGGKRRSTLKERHTQMAMAKHNLRMVEQKTRLAVQKVYRSYEGSITALHMAHEVLKIRQDATKQASGKAAAGASAAEKGAEIDVMKAEIGFRLAHAQMMSVIQGKGAPASPK